jgi:5-oxoprolinase (ATP-hydrolysing) subunit A
VIDLNADIGERPDALDDDLAILRAITSANVACGFHAGDAETMRFVCEQSAALGVAVGAHVSYRDREGFGRRDLDVDADVVTAEVGEQIATLRAVADAASTSVRYVKPHGALYNRAARDPQVAASVATGVAAAGGALSILTLPGSALADAAVRHGLQPVDEGYADRRYLPDGSLAPRASAGAVLSHEDALLQAVGLATGTAVSAGDGGELILRVRSLCLHSDTPGAAQMAADVRAALIEAGVTIGAFA